MTNVLITIETPVGPVDLSVPSRVAITDLLEMLAPFVDGDAGGWTLADVHGPPLEGSETLEEAQVLDGRRLALIREASEPRPIDMPANEAPRVAPAQRDAVVIPDRTSTRERLTVAVRALIGSYRPAGAVGPVDRVARAWEWTDHRRRLEWLLSRPRIHRSVTIGVTGHRSDEVAEALADAFTEGRLERVVLVDGSQSGALSRRLHHPGSGVRALEAALRQSDLSIIERDLLFGRTRRGTLVVPSDLTSHGPIVSCVQFVCESPAAHAALVVIDCGKTPDGPMLDLCDQIVISTTGRLEQSSVPTIVAVWGEGQIPPEGGASTVCCISDDPETMLELAVVAAGGWADLGVGTRVLPGS